MVSELNEQRKELIYSIKEKKYVQAFIRRNSALTVVICW